MNKTKRVEMYIENIVDSIAVEIAWCNIKKYAPTVVFAFAAIYSAYARTEETEKNKIPPAIENIDVPYEGTLEKCRGTYAPFTKDDIYSADGTFGKHSNYIRNNAK